MGSGKYLTDNLKGYRYLIITFCVVFLIVNVLLTILGIKDFAIYFIINAITYLTISLFYIGLNGKISIALSSFGIVIFLAFWVVVAFKLIEMVK